MYQIDFNWVTKKLAFFVTRICHFLIPNLLAWNRGTVPSSEQTFNGMWSHEYVQRIAPQLLFQIPVERKARHETSIQPIWEIISMQQQQQQQQHQHQHQHQQQHQHQHQQQQQQHQHQHQHQHQQQQQQQPNNNNNNTNTNNNNHNHNHNHNDNNNDNDNNDNDNNNNNNIKFHVSGEPKWVVQLTDGASLALHQALMMRAHEGLPKPWKIPLIAHRPAEDQNPETEVGSSLKKQSKDQLLKKENAFTSHKPKTTNSAK